MYLKFHKLIRNKIFFILFFLVIVFSIFLLLLPGDMASLNFKEQLVLSAGFSVCGVISSFGLHKSIFNSRIESGDLFKRVFMFFMIVVFLSVGFRFIFDEFGSETNLNKAVGNLDFSHYFEVAKIWFVLTLFLAAILFLINKLENILDENRASKSSCHQMNETTNPLELVGLNKNEVLRCCPNDLIYIESNGHYSILFYIKDGIVKNYTFRNSIKNFANQILSQGFKQFTFANRSKLINITFIEKLDIEKKELFLKRVYSEVNISKSRLSEIDELWTNHLIKDENTLQNK